MRCRTSNRQLAVLDTALSIAEAIEERLEPEPSASGTAPDALIDVPITIIEPRLGWRLVDWKEIRQYRDLLWFLTLRSVKVRYAQSAIGVGWAVIQPLFSMLVFTVVFGRLAGIESDGVPYAVFSFVALVPWTYFSNALTEGTSSLVQNANMLRKVYFPRLVLPLSAVLAKLVDFGIAMLLLFGLMAWYRTAPTVGVVLLPFLVLLMMLTAAGMGLWLSSLAIQYRDVYHAMNFMVQLLMYAAPVVYPASLIPTEYTLYGTTFNPQLVYALNPLVGVIEGFRAALLGTRSMPWDLLAVGSLSTAVFAVTGLLYFRRRERLFADVA